MVKRTALKFGFISGSILVLWILTVWLLGHGTNPESFDTGEKVGYTIMVLTMSLIFFAVKQTRDRHLSGQMTFGQGMLAGTITNLVASIMFGLFNVVYLRFLAPEFLPTYANHYRAGIENSGRAPELVTQQLAEFDQGQGLFLNPEFNAFVMFATVFLIGVVITLISAMILKR